jgi:hypothetical protein
LIVGPAEKFAMECFNLMSVRPQLSFMNAYGLAIIVILAGLLLLFILIARKGRALRQQQLRPKHAFLHWTQNGEERKIEVVSPFYFGNNPESNIVLPDARAPFEACIFFHNHRFAVQTLQGAGEILINGQEAMAGYLADGDTLTLGGAVFVFRYS